MMLSFREMLLRLAIAAALGAVIGVERELRRRPAGIRTSMAVCMASALFTILSGEIAHRFGDTGSTRIASNIVQGIGFLGAGAIIKEAGGMVGLTTAAAIFLEAAIGMAVGGGLIAVGAAATGIALFALVVVGWIESVFNLKPRTMAFRFTTSHTESLSSEIQKLLAELKVKMRHLRVSMSGLSSIVEFDAEVSHRQQEKIVTQLERPGVVTEVVPVEDRHE
jgi:putative Mg2+ transporter-C (MgtC) family protein